MQAPADTLHTPHREFFATTNAWAFLHWLRFIHGIELTGWAALQRFSAAEPAGCRDAIIRFAELPMAPMRLIRHAGPRDALILRRADRTRLAISRDALAAPGANLPPEIAAPLARLWPPALLARPLADALLHADLRPDDRVLVSGGAWPWLAALLNGSTLILGPPEGLLPAAAEERATVLIAPAAALAQAAFRRPGRRPDLAPLRSIVATGGPLSPEGRARIYTWIKPSVMLLARSGDTLWGNPLEPILARPAATPGLFRPSQQVPAIQ